MTYSEAKTLAKNFLLGDNSNANITDLIIQQSLYEVAMLCEPANLVKQVKCNEKPDDFFRQIEECNDKKNMKYLRKPLVLEDDKEIDLDIQLHPAVVFFICSYLSFKNKDYYEQKANNIIAIYKSNQSVINN